MTPEEEARRWPHHVYMAVPERLADQEAVEDFLKWARDQGLVLAKLDKYGADYVQDHTPLEHLIVRWRGVDLDEYLREKDDMFAYLREHHWLRKT